MILDFGSFVINESSLKKLKKDVHGVLHMSARKRMRRELRDNIITFKFRKRDGSIRTAHGTLHPDYLPPLKGGGPRPEKQMVYYDLDKEGWRSFRSYSFIKILNIKPVDPSATPKTHIKPSPKPVSKSAKADDEDEEIKKTTQVENEEEQEVKKPVSKKKESEDEEEHEYKSPIYDESEDEKRERKDDDEKIKKIQHKDKKEPEEDTEEDKDKNKEKDEEKKSEDE